MSGAARILIVEDNAMIAMDLVDELSDRGFQAVSADTVAAATQLLEAEAISFAVLDIRLKSETPFGFAERLRAEAVPFVFLSGNPASALPGLQNRPSKTRRCWQSRSLWKRLCARSPGPARSALR